MDPARGHSPWQRGVRGDRQVLVCPDCQSVGEWTADLDRCQRCGSVRLIRRLGEVECRECGFIVPPGPTATGQPADRGQPDALAGLPARGQCSGAGSPGPGDNRPPCRRLSPPAAGNEAGPPGDAPGTGTAEPGAAEAAAGTVEPRAGQRGAGAAGQAPGWPGESTTAPGLAEEVARALERVLGRTGSRPPSSAHAPFG